MAKQLFVYQINDGNRWSGSQGKFIKVCTSGFGARVSHCIRVNTPGEATLFARGECPKKYLPYNGKNYTAVKVSVELTNV